MVSLDIILRDLALVFLLFLCQEVRSVDFLKQGITFVLFVGKDAFDRFLAPVLFATRCRNALIGELPCNRIRRFPLKEKPVDSADDHSLFLVHHKVSVLATVVSEKPLERHRDLAVLEPLSLSPCAVLRNGATLFLCKARHDGQEQFALTIESPDVFLLEIALRPAFLQLSDGREAIHCVSRKSAHALRYDQIDSSRQGILDHRIKAISVRRITASYAFVCVHGDKLPIVSPFDVIRVVIHLCLITRQLFVPVR